MGLKETISKAVGSAFSTLKDLTVVATYSEPVVSSYDPITGSNITSSTTSSVIGILTTHSYPSNDILGVVESIPRFIVQTSAFTGTLSIGGIFTIDNYRYEVTSWSVDPANSMYTIDLTRTT